jgi:hypothetical protein
MWYWRSWRIADIYISEEPKSRVGGGQVKFMRAILIRMVVIKLTAIALNGGLP